MEKNSQVDRETQRYRRQRVKRMKQLIVWVVIILILLPTVCCVGLLLKVRQLEKELEQRAQARGQEIEQGLFHLDISDTTVVHAADTFGGSVIVGKADAEGKESQGGEGSETDEALGGEDGLTYEEVLDRDTEKGKVYLTFDDGPGQYTDELLDTLAKYDVKATFFVIGRTDEHSLEMYKRIVDEGHTLAMHSYTHQYGKIYKSVKAFKEDVKKISDLLYGATGVRPAYYRFPGGSSNQVSSLPMTDFIAYLNKKDIVYFDWNVINGDATGKNLTEKQMISNVMSGVRKNANSIVLMHDTVAKDTTVKSLPALIKKIQKEGYVLLPITKYTKPVQHIKADSVE